MYTTITIPKYYTNEEEIEVTYRSSFFDSQTSLYTFLVREEDYLKAEGFFYSIGKVIKKSEYKKDIVLEILI